MVLSNGVADVAFGPRHGLATRSRKAVPLIAWLNYFEKRES